MHGLPLLSHFVGDRHEHASHGLEVLHRTAVAGAAEARGQSRRCSQGRLSTSDLVRDALTQ
jgi:hypothetical protein